MNFLGHAVLSFGNGQILTGNMIGDYVKGKLPLAALPPKIAEGVMLHRKIDGYADTHSAVQRAKLVFRTDFGLYSGAIIDTVFDHFLASDSKFFANEPELLAFTDVTYGLLAKQADWFPKQFAGFFPYMVQQNWLYNYRTVMGIGQSLKGLERRAAHIPPIEKAYEIFITNYYYTNQCYFDFIGDMVKYAKSNLAL